MLPITIVPGAQVQIISPCKFLGKNKKQTFWDKVTVVYVFTWSSMLYSYKVIFSKLEHTIW